MLKEILSWIAGAKKDDVPRDLAIASNLKLVFADLGNTPDAVARSLFALGFRDCKRRDVFGCPISLFIKDHLTKVFGYRDGNLYVCVSFNVYTATWAPSGKDTVIRLAQDELPKTIMDFIKRFDDHGAYPELLHQG